MPDQGCMHSFADQNVLDAHFAPGNELDSSIHDEIRMDLGAKDTHSHAQ